MTRRYICYLEGATVLFNMTVQSAPIKQHVLMNTKFASHI